MTPRNAHVAQAKRTLFSLSSSDPYERKMYLIQDTPSNRRLIGKYIEVFQFPDGRIEIRVAGESLPYSTYDKLGTIDQGAIVDNKRLSHVLRTSQVVQASRDNRVVHRPSTAHRVDGTPIPKNKLVVKLGHQQGKEVTC